MALMAVRNWWQEGRWLGILWTQFMMRLPSSQEQRQYWMSFMELMKNSSLMVILSRLQHLMPSLMVVTSIIDSPTMKISYLSVAYSESDSLILSSSSCSGASRDIDLGSYSTTSQLVLPSFRKNESISLTSFCPSKKILLTLMSPCWVPARCRYSRQLTTLSKILQTSGSGIIWCILQQCWISLKRLQVWSSQLRRYTLLVAPHHENPSLVYSFCMPRYFPRLGWLSRIRCSTMERKSGSSSALTMQVLETIFLCLSTSTLPPYWGRKYSRRLELAGGQEWLPLLPDIEALPITIMYYQLSAAIGQYSVSIRGQHRKNSETVPLWMTESRLPFCSRASSSIDASKWSFSSIFLIISLYCLQQSMIWRMEKEEVVLSLIESTSLPLRQISMEAGYDTILWMSSQWTVNNLSASEMEQRQISWYLMTSQQFLFSVKSSSSNMAMRICLNSWLICTMKEMLPQKGFSLISQMMETAASCPMLVVLNSRSLSLMLDRRKVWLFCRLTPRILLYRCIMIFSQSLSQALELSQKDVQSFTTISLVRMAIFLLLISYRLRTSGRSQGEFSLKSCARPMRAESLRME